MKLKTKSKKSLVKIALIAILSCAPLSGYADWIHWATKDPFTDEIKRFVDYQHERDENGYAFELVFTCNFSFITSDRFIDYFGKEKFIDYRIDKNPVKTIVGIIPDVDGLELLLSSSLNPNPNLEREMKTGKTLFLRFHDFRGHQITRIIDLNGFNESISAMRRNCTDPKNQLQRINHE